MTVKCRICKQTLLEGENCFGVPLQCYLCCDCFEELSPFKHRQHVEAGLVPITRSMTIPEPWRDYLKKFNMTP